jgi:short-subunit dehydrogenase
MKYVLITGASTGIGKDSALYLAKAGLRVFAGVRSDQDFQAISNLHENLFPIKIDILDDASVLSALSILTKTLKEDDNFTLINNAGVVRAGPLEFVPIEEIRFQLETNVTAQVRVTQIFLPLLRKVRDGRIIFTGSQSGYFTSPLMGPYCASKHAIEAIADAFRMELKFTSKIKVVLLQPGQIKTPIWNKSMKKANEIKEHFSSEGKKYYGHIIPKIEARAKNADLHGASTEVVATAIYDAITSNNPRSRYRMGKGAKVSKLIKNILSDKMLDAFLKKVLRIK